ncbi:MAG: hemolysin family protein [Clostridiaceae bacterium]
MENGFVSLFPDILIIIVLVIINAFFAMSEIAIVSLNKNKLNMLIDNGNKKAILLKKLLDEPSKLLATIQVGITLAGFFASASAATGMSEVFGAFLQSINVPYSKQIALVVITIVISFITLLFGELVPKRIGLQISEKVAMFSVKPIMFVAKVSLPFVKFLSYTTNFIIKLVGFSAEDLEEKVSREELKSLIEVSQEHGVINATEKEMIEGIFDFDDTIAKEVMTPRINVFTIDINFPNSKIVDDILEEQYSRIPVYEGDIDNIVGIIYLKDLFIEYKKHGTDDINIKKILRKPYFVPETKNTDELFRELQDTNNHMAILIDEYGGFSGIVTIEDLIEEVMGNIFDEYDDVEVYIKNIDKNTYIVDGLLSIDDVNEYFDIELESDISDTIGGFVITLLGRIPQSGEEVTVKYGNLNFKVEEVNERRIEKLRIIISE